MFDWENISSGDLSRHIINHHHAQLRICVPEILRLARKVEEGHSDHPACPVGLSSALGDIWSELDGHMEKEEMVLFPLITEMAGVLKSAGPIRRMMNEHIEICVGLLKIRHLSHGFKCPKGASLTWRALYLSLSELEEDLMENIHLEDDILFPKVFEKPSAT